MNIGRLVGSLAGAFGGRTLGRMLGGSTGAMVGSLAGSVLGGRGARGAGGGLGSLLGGIMGGGDDNAERQADVDAQPMSEEDGLIIVEAMCNAAKADGHVDDEEMATIMSHLNDVGDEERDYVRSQLAAPLDLASFVARVPQGLEADVYTASLLAIDVDTNEEADYLQSLAAGLGLARDDVAEIHRHLDQS